VGSIKASFMAADKRSGKDDCGTKKRQNKQKQSRLLFRIGETWLSDLSPFGKFQISIRNTEPFGSMGWLFSRSSECAFAGTGLTGASGALQIDPIGGSYSGAVAPSRTRRRRPGAVINYDDH
jgi:hypothetical protein